VTPSSGAARHRLASGSGHKGGAAATLLACLCLQVGHGLAAAKLRQHEADRVVCGRSAEFLGEPDRRKVIDDDSYVVHPFKRHLSNLQTCRFF
jgi:hypothetical protein